MMTLAQVLSNRHQWEELSKDFKLKDNHGTIDNLQWFVTHGHGSNRFREGFEEAKSIAKSIINNHKSGTII